eukprot:CAMPEP_0119108374 /NCGR_PEP_ID=MMETSP1180-20130426/13996_1 /TAXON_ID=3052 ORGANISM="Chlamydomonas cf sp, Strain CCMP681" /NCGR_SAMPLE_ID=MMETSP1180 /ASSEMBLY_ACC=CAM_ASM_000741 /LENGTH=148 /DNA_ID=CAMNT_0007093979 /DNA_START=20 /DNA_END=466 /DNA_ORIENTATION=+
MALHLAILTLLALLTTIGSVQSARPKDTPKEFRLADEDGVGHTVWSFHTSEDKKSSWFFNTKTQTSQWRDPRTADPADNRALALGLFALPFLVVFLLGGLYIYIVYRNDPARLSGPKKGKKNSSLRTPVQSDSPRGTAPPQAESKKQG